MSQHVLIQLEMPADLIRFKLPKGVDKRLQSLLDRQNLRLAHIFDALSYYDDHRDEIEQYIVLNRVLVEDEPTG